MYAKNQALGHSPLMSEIRMVMAMPQKTPNHAISATATKASGRGMRKSRFNALASMVVQAVYIPSGNTMPQYSGVYEDGNLRTPCRQKPSRNSIGTQKVAVAHAMSVTPLMKGKNSMSSGDAPGCESSSAPASVVIATAPALIQ